MLLRPRTCGPNSARQKQTAAWILTIQARAEPRPPQALNLLCGEGESERRTIPQSWVSIRAPAVLAFSVPLGFGADLRS